MASNIAWAKEPTPIPELAEAASVVASSFGIDGETQDKIE